MSNVALTKSASPRTLKRQVPHILLRSGWQSENIGDTAHAPAFLALLETYLPNATATFWPFYSYLSPEDETMLRDRFPTLTIVQGALDEKGEPPAAIAAEMDRSDLFVHNSGPATIGWREAAAFRNRTGRPFGVYGVTYGLYGTPELATLSDAAFVYLRDSVSLELARQAGVRAPITTFGPDVVFALDIRDDARAETYLQSVGLEREQFLVCIPKYRITPFWLHPRKNRPFDADAQSRIELMKEHDHAPMLEAIIRIVREAGKKILIGHEDETELPIGRDWLLEKLPDDVRPHVVWRDTLWTAAEAASIYARSAGMFSNEMHGPIMCIGLGIPAIVCRWKEQSTKGVMWQDIGLGDWLFDLDDESDVGRMPAAALALATDPTTAKSKAAAARAFTRRHFAESMGELKKLLET